MSGPIEPQWDLLPDQPAEFFALTGEYDLRDLKRSYNSFIRQFKPEKFPEEFQRIRSAFETLNDALRYGESTQFKTDFQNTQFDWGFGKQIENDQINLEISDDLKQPSDIFDQGTRSDQPSSKYEFPRLHERIRNESLQELYEELKTKEPKTPYDYYSLAVFSDILQNEDTTFAYWLLNGLKEHSEEPALFELLRQFFASSRSSEGIEELLEATSQIVRSDRFYYLTEKAWDGLLRTASFATFCRVLNSCESNLLDQSVNHMLVFYLHILKLAIWKADDTWINSTFSHVESHYDHMSYWVEEELDFLTNVKNYREKREEFLKGGPVRTIIDQTIVNYCTQNELDADRYFLECQHELASLEEELLYEFKVPAEGFDAILILWEKIADDVFERVDPELVRIKNVSLERHTRRLACQLLSEKDGKEFKKADEISTYLFINVLLVTVLFGLYYLTKIMESFWGTLLNLGGLVLINIVAIIFAIIMTEWLTRKYYRSSWRFEIMRFYQTTYFPLMDLADELERLNGMEIDDENCNDLDDIAELIRKDVGLSFYTTAQRLLTVCQ